MIQLESSTMCSAPSLSNAQSLTDSSFVLYAQSLRDSSFVLNAQSLRDSSFVL